MVSAVGGTMLASSYHAQLPDGAAQWQHAQLQELVKADWERHGSSRKRPGACAAAAAAPESTTRQQQGDSSGEGCSGSLVASMRARWLQLYGQQSAARPQAKRRRSSAAGAAAARAQRGQAPAHQQLALQQCSAVPAAAQPATSSACQAGSSGSSGSSASWGAAAFESAHAAWAASAVSTRTRGAPERQQRQAQSLSPRGRSARRPRPPHPPGCARATPWEGRSASLPAATKPPPLLHTHARLLVGSSAGGSSAVAVSGPRGRTRSGAARKQALRPGIEVLNPLLMPATIPHMHDAYRAAKQRMGRFRVRRSAVAQMGVYTTEDLHAGELLMEYMGDVIRQPLADVREREYERAGLGCYLFALGGGLVVDATRRGNIARFVNHSCDPSCIARVATVEGAKRIFIFAARGIVAGEEITYDYALSEATCGENGSGDIPCNCGAYCCRGTL